MMRLILSFAVAAAALAGCQSDEQFKQQWRQTAVNACVDAARNEPMPAGLDAGQVCSCSIDRIMQGKTAAQLRTHQGGPADEEAAAQCAREAMGVAPGAGGNSAANAGTATK
jgi:hypothetical protein